MKKVTEFLKQHNQCPCQIDAEKLFSAVTKEIETGLQQPCSMPMIPTYIGETKPNLSSPPALLIDAGGTNFRSAIGFFDNDGKPHIQDISVQKMPASEGVLTKEEFYHQIAQNVSDKLSKTNDLGFCFSYNVTMQPDIDGTVAALSKELNAPQVLGTKVGKCTLDAIKQFDQKPRKVVVLNDTVATLIGGKLLHGDKFCSYMGFIFGTGSNLCYIEDTSKIKKLPSDLKLGQKMIINMEAGGFDKLVQGDFDKMTANSTLRPNDQIFEKMTSGKYLGETIFHALKGFENEKSFAEKTNIVEFSLKDVSEFLKTENSKLQNCFCNDADRQLAREICKNLIDRAAKLWAIFNVATAKRIATGNSKPVAIVAEGTTFHKLAGFKQCFKNYLDEFSSQHSFSCQVVEAVEDLNLLGALAAITSNGRENK